MKAKSAVAAVVLCGRAAEGLIFNPPHCALPGLQVLLIFLKKIEATSNLVVGRLELALELLLEPLVAWLRQVTSLLAKWENISPVASQVARPPWPPAPPWRSRRWRGAG